MIEATVIMDGAVPRNERDRCQTLLAYLCDHAESRIVDRFDYECSGEEGPATGGEWHELENEMISAIADIVGLKGYEVALGEYCPGDVVIRVRECPEGDEELSDLWIQVEGLKPGWRIERDTGQLFYSTQWL